MGGADRGNVSAAASESNPINWEQPGFRAADPAVQAYHEAAQQLAAVRPPKDSAGYLNWLTHVTSTGRDYATHYTGIIDEAESDRFYNLAMKGLNRVEARTLKLLVKASKGAVLAEFRIGQVLKFQNVRGTVEAQTSELLFIRKTDGTLATLEKYSEDQARDERGEWTSEGGSGGHAIDQQVLREGLRHPALTPADLDRARANAGQPPIQNPAQAPKPDRFSKPDGNAKINDDHRAYWHTAAEGEFARGYVAHAQSQGGSSTGAAERRASEFQKRYEALGGRSGYVGSGWAEYRDRQNGAIFRVERMANGKSFWGTDHSITQMPPGYTPEPKKS